jgi:hypothetical protein
MGVKKMSKLTVIKVPEKLRSKYRGCGMGEVTINRDNGQVIDFNYLPVKNDYTQGEYERKVGALVKSDDFTQTFFCMLSCYEICL